MSEFEPIIDRSVVLLKLRKKSFAGCVYLSPTLHTKAYFITRDKMSHLAL